MIFQSYALYPQLSVAQNIAFPLKVRDMPKSDIAEKVARVAEILELLPYLARRPSQGDVTLTRLWWLGW
jgi:ABC-type sugar transport system ATPase subunit